MRVASLADNRGSDKQRPSVRRPRATARCQAPARAIWRHSDGRPFKCYAGSAVFRTHRDTYGEVGAGDPLTLFGSTDLLEIAVNRGHASRLLSVERGDTVHLVFDAPPRPEPLASELATNA